MRLTEILGTLYLSTLGFLFLVFVLLDTVFGYLERAVATRPEKQTK